MREMKDSGNKWIGIIPYGWSIDRFKYCTVLYTGNSIKDERKNDYEDASFAKPYISSKDINRLFSTINYENGLYIKNNDYSFKVARKNDILMCIEGGSAGKKKAMLNQDVCFVNKLCCFHSNYKVEHKFLFYYLSNPAYEDEFNYNITGMIGGVSVSKLGDLNIAYPEIDEQKRIATYLDGQCKKIDEIMADIQRQIDTLEDYKKSVISEVVTKGLDHDTTMKDSGVSHIDSIPYHWKTLKLKYASTLKGRIGWQGLRTEEYRDEGPYLVTGTDFNKGYINWSSCVHISKERFEQDKNIQIQENDLLITKDGTIGKIAMAKECPAEVSLNSGVFIVRNNRKYRYIDKFFYYIILSKQFSLWFELAQHGNSTIKHLTQENFYEFTFAYPPIAEQAQIVDFLDDKCGRVDSIIEDKKAQLEAIENYKKSLIYEYVTGKKEVPENE